MKPTVEHLTETFTRLIGPEAFAKAEAAIAAAKAAAEVAAKAAAEKAAAAKAAAAAAAAAAPAAAPATTGTPATAAAPLAPRPSPAAAAPRPAAVPTAPAPRPPAAPAAAPAAPRPAPAPAPVAPPLPTLPVQVVSHAAKGYHFDAQVASTQVLDAARLLDQAGFALDTITGVDWIAQAEMEVVYDYFHPTEPLRVVIRARVPRGTPELPSITSVFPGANWHERETHDFFGITFAGHPNLKPFLLPEDADFHPLRKDYQP